MYQLFDGGIPVGKAHRHRICCYVEAFEHKLVHRTGREYMFVRGVEIVELAPRSPAPDVTVMPTSI